MKALVKKEEKLPVEIRLAQDIIDASAAIKIWEYEEEALRQKLLNWMLKHPQPNGKLKVEGTTFEVVQDTRTKIKNETAARAWALESPATRMAVQIAKVTLAFKGHPMPKWASREHKKVLKMFLPKAPKLKDSENGS